MGLSIPSATLDSRDQSKQTSLFPFGDACFPLVMKQSVRVQSPSCQMRRCKPNVNQCHTSVFTMFLHITRNIRPVECSAPKLVSGGFAWDKNASSTSARLGACGDGTTKANSTISQADCHGFLRRRSPPYSGQRTCRPIERMNLVVGRRSRSV